MNKIFINVDRDTPMIFPPDLRDWVASDSMVHFIVEAVDLLDLHSFSVNAHGGGKSQYPPAMMLSLLVYCYATGRFSSRAIEHASYNDVAVRYICGGDLHPDHDTICAFRAKNRDAFKDAFGKVLLMARELGYLKQVGGISIDGTKIHANASKHSAVSYGRAGEVIRRLDLEVEELVKKAEDADSTPLADGLTLPNEIKRRSERKAQLEHARKMMERRYAEAEQEKYEAKMKEREKQRSQGKKPYGKDPDPPDSPTPPDGSQYNFTDPESRIMKAGNGKHFEQSYNAQAAVDTEGSMLIVGQYVTNHANDKCELAPCCESVDPQIREITTVSADTGYFSEKAVQAIEKDGSGPTVYCAIDKQSHHRTITDLEKKIDPPPPHPSAGTREAMAIRLKTVHGRAVYKKRKETVEPVFGIIKSAMGFRQFMMRGIDKVSIEWNLVTLAYNLKRIYKMKNS